MITIARAFPKLEYGEECDGREIRRNGNLIGRLRRDVEWDYIRATSSRFKPKIVGYLIESYEEGPDGKLLETRTFKKLAEAMAAAKVM